MRHFRPNSAQCRGVRHFFISGGGRVSKNASQHPLEKTNVDHIVLVIKLKIY